MSIFLKQVKKPNGRIYLQICDGIYLKSKKNVKHVVLESLGYVDELKKTYVDPVQYFSDKSSKMEKDRKEANSIPTESPIKNLGYSMIKRINEKLNYFPIFNFVDRDSKQKYSSKDVFNFLLYSRIVHPGSKLNTYDECINSYFDKYTFSKSQMYDSLAKIGESDEHILSFFNEQIAKVYGRKLDHQYFDCTNYYFEIDSNKYTDLKKPGVSKENHNGAIIGMGLLLDADRIPLTYKLYPGNESEKPILNETIKQMKLDNEITGKTIRIADKGLNCPSNIIEAYKEGDGYIYSQRVKRINIEEKGVILSPEGYKNLIDENGEIYFKVKEWIDDYEYENEQRKYKLRQKRIVIWSRKYAAKQAYERDKMIEKASSKTLSSFKRDSIGTAASLFDVMSEEDGKILSAKDLKFSKNTEKIEESAEMDGYYEIITSETNLTWQEILDAYRGLWEIEESFRICKSFLLARPVYVSLKECIKGHFLTCYIALTLLRLLQKKELENEFSASEIVNAIRRLVAYPFINEQYAIAGSSDVFKAYVKKYDLKINAQMSIAKIEKFLRSK